MSNWPTVFQVLAISVVVLSLALIPIVVMGERRYRSQRGRTSLHYAALPIAIPLYGLLWSVMLLPITAPVTYIISGEWALPLWADILLLTALAPPLLLLVIGCAFRLFDSRSRVWNRASGLALVYLIYVPPILIVIALVLATGTLLSLLAIPVLLLIGALFSGGDGEDDESGLFLDFPFSITRS